MQFSSIVAITAFLLATGPAAAQMMQDWDSDASGALSRDEWNTAFNDSTDFSDWDADGDGMVRYDEFDNVLFNRFDADDDDRLIGAEWDYTVDKMYGEEPLNFSLEDYDYDGDQALSRDEFADVGLYDDFRERGGLDTSVDGIGEDDFADGMFDWYDANDDDEIGPGEDRWLQ